MGVSKITRNFQVTVPKDIRELKDLNEGDELIFMVEEGDVKLVKKEEDILEKTKGIWSDMDEDGVEFQRRLRKESEERRERELNEDS